MIEFNNSEHGRTIGKAVKYAYNPEYDIVISRTKGDQLLGGVIYTDYTKRTCAVHIAGFAPNWINKDYLWMIFDYPFNQMKCESLICQVNSSNKRALDFDLKLGFKEVARLPDVFLDGDLIVIRMYRAECRYLDIQPKRISNGQG